MVKIGIEAFLLAYDGHWFIFDDSCSAILVHTRKYLPLDDDRKVRFSLHCTLDGTSGYGLFSNFSYIYTHLLIYFLSRWNTLRSRISHRRVHLENSSHGIVVSLSNIWILFASSDFGAKVTYWEERKFCQRNQKYFSFRRNSIHRNGWIEMAILSFWSLEDFRFYGKLGLDELH